MNYEEIISDFDALRQEILSFKNQMTIDDYYFYQWKYKPFNEYGPDKFEERLDELCKKHFKVNYLYALKDALEKQFLKASKNESSESCLTINQLCRFFFGSEFSYEKKYGVKYKAIGEPDWKGGQAVEEIPVWKGKFHVQEKELAKEDGLRHILVMEQPEKHNLFLKNWQAVLNRFIEIKWSIFSGMFYSEDGFHNATHSEENPQKLSITDYTCFLALKNALRSDLYITTHENEILLVVSSGIAAKISIRKTGKYVTGLLQSEPHIYSMTKFSYDVKKEYDFEDKTILHISGYTNSRVNIPIPNGYYFVNNDYIAQVEFIAAPILLNNGVMPLMATADHASADLLDDEEEERKRQEEDED